MNALHFTAMKGHVEAAKLLIAAGTDKSPAQDVYTHVPILSPHLPVCRAPHVAAGTDLISSRYRIFVMTFPPYFPHLCRSSCRQPHSKRDDCISHGVSGGSLGPRKLPPEEKGRSFHDCSDCVINGESNQFAFDYDTRPIH